MWQRFKESGLFRIIKNKYLLVTVAFFAWVIFFDSNSIIEWSSIRSNINRQEKEKAYYKQEIKSAEEKLQELSSNKDSLEKFAREQFYFHEEDEDLYIVKKKEKK
ncbi:MAG: septum formation initiator family protein [Bacteroidales bacterium]|nr:septum formation initiator family protein [Bacteroidales bacterium]MDD2281748.1 septum formation initiator family protein [Bacteroidales bacterium]HNW49218.1 septum formation initiator family protein [Bacteroidales bacterium]HPS96502.1 septum formation initiator family protein [Bacteroidales bacterium]